MLLYTSMMTAGYVREQPVVSSRSGGKGDVLLLFLFPAARVKIRPRDLEIIFVSFGIIHIMLVFTQYFSYPKILFDVFMMSDRGTIRIYLKGSDYLAFVIL